MSFNQFLVQLSLVATGVLLLLWGTGQVFDYSALDKFSIIGVLFFYMLCFVVFTFAKQAVHQQDPNTFSRLVLLAISTKILLVVAIVAMYVKLYHPPTHWFLLSFLLTYFGFTIFETHFLMRLSKETPTLLKKNDHDK